MSSCREEDEDVVPEVMRLPRDRPWRRELVERSDEMGEPVLHLGGGGNLFVYVKPNHVPATFTVLNLPTEDIEEVSASAGAREK